MGGGLKILEAPLSFLEKLVQFAKVFLEKNSTSPPENFSKVTAAPGLHFSFQITTINPNNAPLNFSTSTSI